MTFNPTRNEDYRPPLSHCQNTIKSTQSSLLPIKQHALDLAYVHGVCFFFLSLLACSARASPLPVAFAVFAVVAVICERSFSKGLGPPFIGTGTRGADTSARLVQGRPGRFA